jgi:hypothetical protein
MDARGRSNDPNAADVRVAAVTAGVPDVFVLRRVAAGRFVHLGGAGRGEGWAGIVEVTLDGEADLDRALAGDEIVRVGLPDRQRVFGRTTPGRPRSSRSSPTRSSFSAPPTPRSPRATSSSRGRRGRRSRRSGRSAPQAAGRQPRAARGRARGGRGRARAGRGGDARADRARRESLSCELGVMDVADGDRLAVAERGWPLRPPPASLRDALASVSESHHFPFRVQDARRSPLPGPLADDPGIRSYYLLELTGRARGVLFVAHTDAAPRGVTLLCRRLGVRVAEGASVVLGAGLTREWIAAEAARIEAGFAGLEQ